MMCHNCGTVELTGLQTKFCSIKCNNAVSNRKKTMGRVRNGTILKAWGRWKAKDKMIQAVICSNGMIVNV